MYIEMKIGDIETLRRLFSLLPSYVLQYISSPQNITRTNFLQWVSRCASGERQQILLSSGRASGLILRLTSQDFYR